MRRALIYAWCELRNAAVDAHRIYDNPYTARRAAAQARGLIGVFGKNLARRPFGRAVRGGE